LIAFFSEKFNLLCIKFEFELACFKVQLLILAQLASLFEPLTKIAVVCEHKNVAMLDLHQTVIF